VVDRLAGWSRPLEWAVAAAPAPGEAASGDLHLVCPTTDGLLVAVVDGLGHGTGAATAARRAVDALEAYREESTVSLVRRCHAQLLATRGAAMCIAKFRLEDDTMTWLSIGNVAALLLRADSHTSRPMESAVARSGVVGHRLPALQGSITKVWPGDLLILATDGIHRELGETLALGLDPRTLSERILERHRRPDDDALVLAARYQNEASA